MEIFIIREGQQTGPFNEGTVQSLLRDGGLRSKDLAWRKGLPGWVPVGEILNPIAEQPSSPPPRTQSGIAPQPQKPASAKQKALLRYLGTTLENGITREDAALAISDAMENPKQQARFAKWQEEKFRLNPEVFQDEMDFRRANRIAQYIERCQTEGAEVVKDLTKAHVQVLIESLDKGHANWESDSRAALWNFLLPSVTEHFPQLVSEEWKGKLKFGAPSKIAESITKTSDLLPEPPHAPGTIHAAFRGILYGVGVLVIALGGHYLFKGSPQPEPPKPAPAAANTPTPAPPIPVPAGEVLPVQPLDAPLIAAANPGGVAVEAPPVAAPKPVAPEAPNPPVGAPPPPPGPIPTFTPAPAPGGPPIVPPAIPPVGVPPVANQPPATPPAVNPPVGNPASPATPPANPVPKTIATLKQPLGVALPNGHVTLPAGTKMRILGIEGKTIRVAWNNNVFNVPALSTDIAETAAPATPPPVVPPPLVSAPPIIPVVPKKPPSPVSDL